MVCHELLLCVHCAYDSQLILCRAAHLFILTLGLHNPEKLSAGLDQVVSAYDGKEEQLNAALRQQYGQDLTTTNTVKTDLRERLVAFYKVSSFLGASAT